MQLYIMKEAQFYGQVQTRASIQTKLKYNVKGAGNHNHCKHTSCLQIKMNPFLKLSFENRIKFESVEGGQSVNTHKPDLISYSHQYSFFYQGYFHENNTDGSTYAFKIKSPAFLITPSFSCTTEQVPHIKKLNSVSSSNFNRYHNKTMYGKLVHS